MNLTVSGMSLAARPGRTGGAAVRGQIVPRRELAGRLISRWRVTHWTNIPTMVIDLLASPNFAQFDLSSLVYIGGGVPATAKRAARFGTGIYPMSLEIADVYRTECKKLGREPKGVKCPAIDGLISEADELAGEVRTRASWMLPSWARRKRSSTTKWHATEP